MPRRFFRKFAFKRDELAQQRLVAPFRHWLEDHGLWGIRRKTVVPGVAWGVFVAFLPVPGTCSHCRFGMPVLRCNIPVAALATFVSNPVTIGPIFYFSYRVGARLLSIEPGQPDIELSFDWLQSTFATIWQPLLLGSVLVGSICALLAYIVLDLLWRFSISDYKSRKRNDRKRST